MAPCALLFLLGDKENFILIICQCKTQTAGYWFHHANEYVTTIVPLFSIPKNNSPPSVHSLHFTLPFFIIKSMLDTVGFTISEYLTLFNFT